MGETVLVSTHDLEIAGPIRSAFEAEGHSVRLVTEPEDLRGEHDAGLLVLTGGITDGAGALLRRWTAHQEVPVFAIVSGEGGEADEKIRTLAPLKVFPSTVDPGEVALTGRRAMQRRHLQAVTGIIGETEGMREVMERVVQIAPVESTVLVTGESGTGKELVARGLHGLSPRRHRPFIAVNVAALSETLLESELFGHEKGAFTGAIDSRKGFFELAHHGTIFLDEIGEMPLTTQTKLLRVLEQREFLRVGGERPIRVDLRVITATNQDLRALVATRKFRKDLYYRLNILNIRLPPLRERREDIPRLIQHFIRELAGRMDRPFPGISPQAMEILRQYDWPGNVRELRNLVESMVVLSPGKEIRPEDIPTEIRHPPTRDRFLPVPLPGQAVQKQDDSRSKELRPELEFVFRTLVELRVDMDELRRQFEEYRDEMEDRVEFAQSRIRALPRGRPGSVELGSRPWEEEELSASEGGGRDPMEPEPEEVEVGEERDQGPTDEGLVFEPGMTMEDLEREAIVSVLRKTGGNRREAAESLGIGERTLYRKIRKYGLEV